MADRFAADLAALWPLSEPLGLAVSGGPDSLALLALAHRARPQGLAVATVDHGLRREAAAEAAMVAAACAARGLAHRTRTVAVEREGNLQANARHARYAALATWSAEQGLRAVATAHHADDQAETLLMRLVRGAGVRGLAAIRPRAPWPVKGTAGAPPALLRPLLGWRRDELAEVVAEAGLEPAHDPGNSDERFERAAIRRRLAEAPWLPPERLAAAAAHLAQADEALVWATGREMLDQAETLANGWRYRPRAPRAVRLRVLERLLVLAGDGSEPRGGDLARLLDALEAGRSATLAGALCRPQADRSWHIAPAPPHRRT
ncbi:MAG: tRNA lysidine(34) synthetase TilS [Novosphingobium sp.]